jgi:membrane protease YdiL (CAAX protease family)
MKRIFLISLMAYAAIIIGLFWARSAWVALLGFHAVLLAILFIAKPSIPASNLLKGFSIPYLVGFLLLGAGGGILLFLNWHNYSITPDLSARLSAIGLTSSTWPAFIAYFTLVNPWIEEYFWRGYLGDPSNRILPVDFLFSGYHLFILYDKTTWPWILVAFVSLALVAWMWRWAARKTNGLLIPALSHMAADFSILLTVYWMCS